MVSLLSSLLFLIAIALVYAATGTSTWPSSPSGSPSCPTTCSLVLQLLLLLAFGIKAAVFPLSAWLPDTYPTAPAPVTAVFAGLLTKVGVYAIIRTADPAVPRRPARPTCCWCAALADHGGRHPRRDRPVRHQADAVLHPGQPHRLHGLRRRRSRTDAGLAGAIFYVAHHITIQTTLFLVVGLIERRAGSTALDRLGGLARLAPVLARAVLRPRDEPGRDPAAVRVPRQGGPAPGRGRRSAAPLAYALVAGGVADQPAHPVRRVPGVEHGVLAGAPAGHHRADASGCPSA